MVPTTQKIKIFYAMTHYLAKVKRDMINHIRVTLFPLWGFVSLYSIALSFLATILHLLKCARMVSRRTDYAHFLPLLNLFTGFTSSEFTLIAQPFASARLYFVVH